MTAKGVEKRKFQRLDMPLDVTLTILTDEEVPGGISPLHVKSLNLSMEGICLETRNIVIGTVNMLSGSPGSRENLLQLDISVFPDEKPVRTVGEVCWYDVARDCDEFRYQVGIVFLEIDKPDQEQLRRFLKGQKKNKGFFEQLWSLVNN